MPRKAVGSDDTSPFESSLRLTPLRGAPCVGQALCTLSPTGWDWGFRGVAFVFLADQSPDCGSSHLIPCPTMLWPLRSPRMREWKQFRGNFQTNSNPVRSKAEPRWRTSRSSKGHFYLPFSLPQQCEVACSSPLSGHASKHVFFFLFHTYHITFFLFFISLLTHYLNLHEGLYRKLFVGE